MIRLFVAIDLPELVAERLGGLCCGLKGARWVDVEQMHLTLRFIGEVDGGLFREIRDELVGVAAAPFAIRLAGLGCFPPRKTPRVLWAGVEPAGQGSPLVALRNRVESRLTRLGLEPEGRKYAPHITIARLDNPPLHDLTRYLSANGLFATEEFTVDEFHLYSSVLTPKGAIHAIEASYSLEGK